MTTETAVMTPDNWKRELREALNRSKTQGGLKGTEFKLKIYNARDEEVYSTKATFAVEWTILNDKIPTMLNAVGTPYEIEVLDHDGEIYREPFQAMNSLLKTEHGEAAAATR